MKEPPPGATAVPRPRGGLSVANTQEKQPELQAQVAGELLQRLEDTGPGLVGDDVVRAIHGDVSEPDRKAVWDRVRVLASLYCERAATHLVKTARERLRADGSEVSSAGLIKVVQINLGKV